MSIRSRSLTVLFVTLFVHVVISELSEGSELHSARFTFLPLGITAIGTAWDGNLRSVRGRGWGTGGAIAATFLGLLTVYVADLRPDFYLILFLLLGLIIRALVLKTIFGRDAVDQPQ